MLLSWTTPLCAARRPALASSTCAKPARRRCTCASVVRRTNSPAITASTFLIPRSSWPTSARWMKSVDTSGADSIGYLDFKGNDRRHRSAPQRRFAPHVSAATIRTLRRAAFDKLIMEKASWPHPPARRKRNRVCYEDEPDQSLCSGRCGRRAWQHSQARNPINCPLNPRPGSARQNWRLRRAFQGQF